MITNNKTVTLNNGIEMPLVGFGVFQIQDGEPTQKVVEEAIRVGYRLIDTAEAMEMKKQLVRR